MINHKGLPRPINECGNRNIGEEIADHTWCRKDYYRCIKMSAQHYEAQVVDTIKCEVIVKL